MFGHDDMNPQQGNQGGMPLPPPDGSLSHSTPADAPAAHTAPAFPSTSNTDNGQLGGGAPAMSDDDTTDTTDTAGNYIMDDAPQADDPSPTTTSGSITPVAPTVSTDDLLDIKQGALQQLTPLLGHLDQSPEEKFRTTMMMIQASDNQDLLKTAYEAAQQIEDEKTRAQALLDVVNEINYFTQQGVDGTDVDQTADSGQESM